MPPEVQLRDLGLVPYGDALALQRELHQRLIKGEADQTLLLCQHPAVITCGRSTKDNSLIVSQEILKKEQVEFYEVERGGDITYHGPGQLVAYPLLDLHQFKTDVGWYMRSLEEVIIRSLHSLSVDGQRIEGKTGVWTSPSKKIASLGIKISRWRTMHGLSVNVQQISEQGFRHIIPCGIEGARATSIETILQQEITLKRYNDAFIRFFEEIFSVLLRPTPG